MNKQCAIVLNQIPRGFNTAVNAKFFRKVLIFGGLGFFAVVTSAIFLGWRSDKRRKVEGVK